MAESISPTRTKAQRQIYGTKRHCMRKSKAQAAQFPWVPPSDRARETSECGLSVGRCPVVCRCGLRSAYCPAWLLGEQKLRKCLRGSWSE